MNEHPSTDQLLLDRLQEAIEDNLQNEQFGVPELADAAGLSKSQLNRKLQSLTTQSASQFIREYRLKKAMELLQSKAATPTEVSYKVGFGSPSYFSTCFKELYGYPPGEVSSRRPDQPKKRTRIPAKPVWIMLAILILVTASYFSYKLLTSSEDSKPVKTAETDPSIVVLPFKNVNNNPELDAFSEGISEEIRHALEKIRGLMVSGKYSGISYKDISDQDYKMVGEELGVKNILLGSVQQSGTKIRIWVRLISSEDGYQLWSDQYDKDLSVQELFDIYEQIASAVLSKLNVQFTDSFNSIGSDSINDTEAYMLYLAARQKLITRGGENLKEAKRFFEKSIALDANNDQAFSGLGRTLTLLPYFSDVQQKDVFIDANAAANQAIKLNPRNAEAYLVFGDIAFSEWEWEASEVALNKALELNPNDAEVYNLLGDYYGIVRNVQKSIEMEQKALKLDPLHSINHHDLGYAYSLDCNWEQALKYALNAKNMDLEFWRNEELLFNSYVNLNRLDEAEQAIIEINKSESYEALKEYCKCSLYIVRGEIDLASNCVQQMAKVYKTDRPDYIVDLFLRLGDFREAAKWTELTLSYGRRPPRGIPDDYMNYPELRKALNKPKVKELLEIRRRNLSI